MEDTSSKGYRLEYRIQNHRPDDPLRTVDVLASPEEVAQLADQGFWVRERFFDGQALQDMRDALDRLESAARNQAQAGEGFSRSRMFGGLFLRYLMDKDPVFFRMLKFEPFLSVARALMGPQIQVSMSARITYPDEPNQETMWHQHLRYIPKPLPPWFVRPHAMDVLIYLDDVTDDNGPLCVVPGSHHRLQEEPPGEYYGDFPDQWVLHPPAGTAVMLHANTWHRAMPNNANGTKRRLLIFNYAPTYLKRSFYGVKPENGLTRSLEKEGDPEMLEILAVSGYM